MNLFILFVIALVIVVVLGWFLYRFEKPTFSLLIREGESFERIPILMIRIDVGQLHIGCPYVGWTLVGGYESLRAACRQALIEIEKSSCTTYGIWVTAYGRQDTPYARLAHTLAATLSTNNDPVDRDTVIHRLTFLCD